MTLTREKSRYDPCKLCSQAEENDYTTAPRQNNWTAEHGRRAEMLGEVDAEETGRIRAR